MPMFQISVVNSDFNGQSQSRSFESWLGLQRIINISDMVWYLDEGLDIAIYIWCNFSKSLADFNDFKVTKKIHVFQDLTWFLEDFVYYKASVLYHLALNMPSGFCLNICSVYVRKHVNTFSLVDLDLLGLRISYS